MLLGWFCSRPRVTAVVFWDVWWEYKLWNFSNWIRWLECGSCSWKFAAVITPPTLPSRNILPMSFNSFKTWWALKHKYNFSALLNLPLGLPKSRGVSNPVYLHKQSPTQLLWQKQLNLSCFVSSWFLLSLWLFACLRTMEAGEWQQIVGMHLNETNYYMLTAFTMADLKELASFNLAPQDSL